MFRIQGVVYDATTELISKQVLKVGDDLIERLERMYCGGSNGTQFVSTVLLSCLLPTIGLHVLSITDHTDITKAFWFHDYSI